MFSNITVGSIVLGSRNSNRAHGQSGSAGSRARSAGSRARNALSTLPRNLGFVYRRLAILWHATHAVDIHTEPIPTDPLPDNANISRTLSDWSDGSDISDNVDIRAMLSDWSDESGISDIQSANRRQLVDQIMAKNPVFSNGKIQIRGKLRIENSAISSLPKDLSVKTLYLKNCENITSLPSSLQIRGILRIENSAISSLPKYLSVKTLYLKNCENITSLPSSLQINHALKINNVPNLTTVGNNFYVSGLKFKNITNDQLAVMLSNIRCDTLSIYSSTIASIPAGSGFRSLFLYRCQGPIELLPMYYHYISFDRCLDIILPENLRGECLAVTFDDAHPIAIPDNMCNRFAGVFLNDLSSQSGQAALEPNDPDLEIRSSGMQLPAVTINITPTPIGITPIVGFDASTLPELVAKFGCDASHPLWTNAANQISDRAWNSFALFLSKFNDDMPGLKDEMKPILEAMQADYIVHGQPEAIQTEFISGVTNQATQSTESCVDRVKLGFVAMQLKLAAHDAITPVDKENAEFALEKYQAIVRFVQSLGDFEIAYDSSKQQFIPVEIERNGSDKRTLSAIFQLKIDNMNADGRNIEVVCIRDEVEDALALLLKDETIKPFVSNGMTVFFSNHVTLDEQKQTSALQYVNEELGIFKL